MGSWRADQSKGARRYIWGETRGKTDATWRDFMERLKAHSSMAPLRLEKIGSEIQAWREVKEDSGKLYWVSCLRFVDDGWGYWTVFYRPDERRWRTTALKDLPLGRALTGAAEFYAQTFL